MTAPITTAVTICNSALLKMGADKISSLSQTTRAAVLCNTLYYILRDEVMGAAPWKFAKKRAVLTPTSTTPAFTYSYEYDIPSDCLRLLQSDDTALVWVQEGTKILSNESSLNMIYLYRNEDESSWDARFCEALSWRLAMELALCLTQSTTMKQEAEKSYNATLSLARATNAVIGAQPVLEADTWSDARRGNNRWRTAIGRIS